MSITVTVEKAELLKEAGRTKRTTLLDDGVLRFSPKYPRIVYDGFYMPTAQEILDELPRKIGENVLVIDKFRGYNAKYGKTPIVFLSGDNLSDVLADLRIRCKKEGHLD